MSLTNGGMTRGGLFSENGPLIPLSPFGQVIQTRAIPKAQIDAVYGIREQHEVFTATGGSVTAADGNFVCQTGTSVGGYGVIRSHRFARYRPGQSLICRFTAAFDPDNATPLSLQAAGAFNSTSGFFVGYDGSSFGCMHRTGGELHTVILEITTPASGAETLTLTLNGTAYAPTVTSGTAAQNANEIEIWMKANQSAWNVQARGDQVAFQRRSVGEASGTYSVASTGALAGTFSTYATGALNTENWTYQASFNRDKLDGTGASGMTIDPSKLNVFLLQIPYLGAGAVTLFVMSPSTGRWVLVHVWEFPNSRTTPSMSQPTLYVGWVSASLGSTTNITVKGASGMIGALGEAVAMSRPRGAFATNATVSTTEVNVLAIRARITFGGTYNLKEVLPTFLTFSNEGGKTMAVRVLLNPTINASTPGTWTLVDEDESVIEVSETAMQFSADGSVVAAATVGGGESRELRFASLGFGNSIPVHLEPDDILAVVARITSGASASATASLTWIED